MIVVGVDYSEDSRTALRWAVSEGGLHATGVTAVHVGPPVYDLVAHTPYAENRRAALLPALDAFVAETVDATVLRKIVDGPPAEGLVRCSTSTDLVVVGRHGEHALVRRVLGSTARDVVRSAPCPVAVIPPGAGDGPAVRVVTGTDGSEAAAAGVRWAAREAVRRHVPLVVVHAGDEGDLLDTVVAKVTADTGGVVGVSGVLSDESAADALLDAARAGDLLVVGTRGGNALTRLFGSTSEAVVERSRCPVVVVPPEG